MTRVLCAAAMLLGSLLSGPSLAQTAATPDLNHADTHELVTQAARAAMLDLAAAKEIEQKIKDPAYKAYARKVIADDSKMEDSLKSLAPGIGMSLPDRLDTQRALALKDLQASNGAQLQQKFRASQIGGGRLTIEILHDLAQKRDPKLTAWLKTALPTAQNHLEAATQLRQIPSAPQG